MKKYAIIILTILPTVALAHGWHRHWDHESCIRETSEIISETILSKGACQAGDSLEIAEMWKSYPLLQDGEHHVEYWRGSFTIELKVSQVVRRQIINLCHGGTILDETSTLATTSQRSFAVDNPNLHDTVATSYELVPMTNAEATRALAAAKAACAKF